MTVRRVLVTGSAGFIGSAVVPRLKETGWEVLEMDLKSGGDIVDREAMRVQGELDAVVHLAGRRPGRSSAQGPEAFLREHFLGTLNVLELCRLRGARCVLASSNVYGEPRTFPVAEDHPLAPANAYTLSKAFGEELGRRYSLDSGLTVLALRLFNVYGPGQGPDFLIPSILRQIPSGRVELFGDPDSRRDFVHVADVADALAKALDAPASGFQAVNIGSGTSHAVGEVVDMIVTLSGRPVDVLYRRADRASVTRTMADITLARRLLGWEPRIRLEDGLRDLVVRTLEPGPGGPRPQGE